MESTAVSAAKHVGTELARSASDNGIEHSPLKLGELEEVLEPLHTCLQDVTHSDLAACRLLVDRTH